jgi:hypothetical protein
MAGFRDSTTDERTSMANSTARFFATSKGGESDLSDLLEALGTVREVRKARGRVFPLTFVLAVSLVAVLAGASNFREIGDHVTDLPGPLLGRLGARWCHFVLGFRCPSERTIRRVLGGVDADELDRVSGAWLRKNADVGADGVVTVAIDGKVLRGSWTGENKRFTLFSAMPHESGVTPRPGGGSGRHERDHPGGEPAGGGSGGGRGPCRGHGRRRPHPARDRRARQGRAWLRLLPGGEG